MGLQKLLGSSAQIRCVDGKKLNEAKQLAAEADAVVLVVGYSHKDEGEYASFGPITLGGDRKQLGLHDKDVNLIKAIAPLNKNTAVVLIGSNAILMEDWKSTVPAILHAFYPGMEGGTAIARVLVGEVNPGGTAFSIPRECQPPARLDGC
jgi:beta-glucosidase